jgi:hypothetical protein
MLDGQGRLLFQEHSFFSEQPAKGVTYYFLTAMLHDWPEARKS